MRESPTRVPAMACNEDTLDAEHPGVLHSRQFCLIIPKQGVPGLARRALNILQDLASLALDVLPHTPHRPHPPQHSVTHMPLPPRGVPACSPSSLYPRCLPAPVPTASI